MNNEKQETVADIVAEMRSVEIDDPSFDARSLVAVHTLAKGWANRIEEATKREIIEAVKPVKANINKVNECLDLSTATSTVAVAIYDLIREVGRGEITADNALHLMIEEYKRLHDITDRLDKLADVLEEEEK